MRRSPHLPPGTTRTLVAAALAAVVLSSAVPAGAQGDGTTPPPPPTSVPTGDGRASTTTPPTAPPTSQVAPPGGAPTAPTTTVADVPPPVDVASIDELLAEARARAQQVRNAQLAAAATTTRAAVDKEAAAQGRLDAATVVVRGAEALVAGRTAEVEAIRGRVAAFASDAYMRVGTDADGMLARFRLGTGDRDPKVIDAQQARVYADGAVRATRADLREATARLDGARAERAAAAEEELRRRVERDRAAEEVAAARRAEEELRTAPLDVPAAATVSSLYGSVGPTILGRSLLTPEDLASFVRAKGRPHRTVDVEQLARHFIEEGESEGVRADLAWVQSIIETGWFSFANSMVDPGDHNYAGIGACDTCTRGFGYATPQLGARAQMQLLRTYADARLTADRLANPPVRSSPERSSVRGCCPTWMALSGVWATGPGYGVKILGLYNELLRFAVERRRAAAASPVVATPDPAPVPTTPPQAAGG